MDKIRIDGLEIFANHGVLEAEKVLGQKFIVSAELDLDLRRAGRTDDLTQTVNYAEISAGITKVVTEKTSDLIETVAEDIAAFILHKHPRVRGVTVVVEKPWAPIGQGVRNLSVQIKRKWSKIYLGLGANMAEPQKALDAAIKQMESEALRVRRCSSYYKTKPISDIPQSDYINCVVEAETTYPPCELIAHLLAVEKSLGREREVRWGPRTIDIDVLTYDDMISSEPEIILPHPRMHERLFVLVPFCELDPYAVHPLLKQRIIELKTTLEKKQTL